nr:hypothetical protein [Tanacetum cinerariifolium]
MHTRSSSNLPGESSPNLTSLNPKCRNRRRSKQPFILEESLVDMMAVQLTMEKLQRAPTEGYAEAIVVLPILADHFELKHKAARRWLEKEPPRSILTWEDLAWDRYKDLLRACPHHGFTELHQLDTFYNALNPADQDSLNSAIGGNLLERRTQDVLTIIENKSKVQNTRNKSIVYQVKSSDANSSSYSEIAKLTHAVNQQTSAVTTAMTAILKQFQATPPPASVKAVEEICVTCGGAHPFFQMNTASTSGSGPLPSNTIANLKGELKAITTRSRIVLDGPSVPMPLLFINPEEDERIEETLTDPELTVILKKLPEKLGDPGKFLISCGFSKLKCKALAGLGANINLMPLSVWKKLGLHELISTRMTLELANRVICTPTGIAEMSLFWLASSHSQLILLLLIMRAIQESPLIFGRPFLRTARALIDVHGEEMILRDGDERLTFNMRHDTSSYLNQPKKESINMINIFNDSCEDYLENFTTSSSPNHLLEEFTDKLALITFPPRNDDLPFDIESDLKEIEYLLNHDPTKEMDSILEDSVDEDNLAKPNDNLFDTIPEMFTDEHAQKIKVSKLLIDELDLPRSNDFLPSPEYDSFLFEDFFKVDAFPSTNNEEKVFNLGILIYENLFEVNTRVAPDKNEKKIAISHASLILMDFNPPLYELPFNKEVPGSKTLLSFSSENEEKDFKPRILTSKGVHSSLLPELSHRGPKAFKVIKILESPMEIFPCSFGEDIRILDVPCLHFYPP